MLLTITLNRHPATDLGYLLHKHPAKLQEVEIKNGIAHIFYPEATDERTTCALLMDIDPVALVRNDNPRGDSFALEQYVNDRPYVATSFMSTALAKSFSSALNGRCKDKPELPEEILPLETKLSVVSVRGADLLTRLFEPLGYEVIAERHALDEQFSDWGMSRYYNLTLKGQHRLKDLLSHLFILLPVLDGDKHYWVNDEEVQKLLEKGKGWLETHPEKELITHRYLRNQKSLAGAALAAMKVETIDEETSPKEEETSKVPKVRLHDGRLQTVCDRLVASGAKSVIDLGCGEGKLLKLLWPQSQFRRIAGMDVAAYSLDIAARKLNLHRFAGEENPRLQLFQGSLIYTDQRIKGFDAAALVEVIEHLDEDRLKALKDVVFGFAAPPTVIITTPNREWNKTFNEDNEEKMRHSDHRFEWTREEFKVWCTRIEQEYNYQYTIEGVGDEAEDWGAPTQMAIFTKQQLTHAD